MVVENYPVFDNCAACKVLLTAENMADHLCIRCHLEIEDEKAELEEEDAASVALVTAAAEAGLSCGPCSEPFDSVLLIGLEEAFGNDHIKWKQWAVDVGVALLKERLI